MSHISITSLKWWSNTLRKITVTATLSRIVWAFVDILAFVGTLGVSSAGEFPIRALVRAGGCETAGLGWSRFVYMRSWEMRIEVDDAIVVWPRAYAVVMFLNLDIRALGFVAVGSSSERVRGLRSESKSLSLNQYLSYFFFDVVVDRKVVLKPLGRMAMTVWCCQLTLWWYLDKQTMPLSYPTHVLVIWTVRETNIVILTEVPENM